MCAKEEVKASIILKFFLFSVFVLFGGFLFCLVCCFFASPKNEHFNSWKCSRTDQNNLMMLMERTQKESHEIIKFPLSRDWNICQQHCIMWIWRVGGTKLFYSTGFCHKTNYLKGTSWINWGGKSAYGNHGYF